MSERTEYTPGTPSWADLQTSDPEAAKTFYRALFGWEYDEQPIPESDAVYTMAKKHGKDVAAITGLPEDQVKMGVPPHWNTYVTVTDVDASAGLVAGAGGTLLAPPFDVVDAGRMAVVADPTGAVILLWQAKNHPGAALVNEHGTITWNELMSPDIPKAAAFYRALFGWDSETHGGDVEYTEFKVDGSSIAGAMNPPMPGIPANWGVYFAVDDCDAIVAQAKDRGATVFAEPMDLEVGRFAALGDPQGATFSVIKLANPPA